MIASIITISIVFYIVGFVLMSRHYYKHNTNGWSSTKERLSVRDDAAFLGIIWPFSLVYMTGGKLLSWIIMSHNC